MKSRKIKLMMCLLASTLLLTGSAAPTMAAEVQNSAAKAENQSDMNLVSGVSLLLAEVSTQASIVNVQGTSTVTAEKQAENTAAVQTAQKTEDTKETEDKYAKMAVAQVDGYVNIRSKASTDSKIVGKMKNNAVATIVKKKGDWYKIKSGSIEGYVSAEFLVVGDKELIDSVSYRVAKVQTETLKVRKKASADAAVLGLVSKDDKLKVVSEKNKDWIKVKTADGKGYVSAEYVKVMTTYQYAERLDAGSGDGSGSSGGGSVASYALQFTGNPYVWGGTSLTNGADCSGFVMSVYAHFGVSLPHSSSAQRSVGRSVSYSEAQPGDIICYSGHVGIYIGGGQIVHASNPSDGIKVSSATYRSILSVRRVF